MPNDPRDHQQPESVPGAPTFENTDDYDGRTTCGLLEED